VDINDVGVGAVLLQEGKDDIYLLKSYFSLKFDKDQKHKSQLRKNMSYFYL
jgi:hypothetical protein